MSMTKAEVRSVFREAALRSYAHIPPEGEIRHVFSESFYRRMEALIAEERRGSWRLLSRQRRRALVVAAILAAALLLTACSPTLREAVTDFVVTVYERFVSYGAATNAHEEIETIYVLDPVPEGFEFVSQTQQPHFVKTVYQDGLENKLVLQQAAGNDFWSSMDKEQGAFEILTKDGYSVLLYTSDSVSTAVWSCEGYYMKLSYLGMLSADEMETFILSLSPMA